MALNYTRGTISSIGEVVSGQTRNGNIWQRSSLMLEVPGYQGSVYKIIFQVSGDRVDDLKNYKVGDKVEVGWSIYAREYNERWYNNVDLISIKSQNTEEAPAPAPASAPEDLEPQNHDDDLPF